MNLRMLALVGVMALTAQSADAQNRVNPNRSADQLNARVLELLNAPAAATPVVAATAPTVTASTPGASGSGVYVGGSVGTNLRNQADYALGAVLGYQINRNLAVELTYDYMRETGDQDGQMVMGNVVYSRALRGTPVTPYVLAGAGVGWNTLGTRGEATNLALYNVGAGARVAVTNRVSLDARYRYVGAFNEGELGNHHMITLGAQWRF